MNHFINSFNLIRIYNDQLKNVEKAFLDVKFSLKRDDFQHTIFSPSIFNVVMFNILYINSMIIKNLCDFKVYGGGAFPSISDAISNYKTNFNESLKIETFKNEIEMQISTVIYSIYSATYILKEPLDFKRYF